MTWRIQETWVLLLDFMDRGGPVMWVIAAVTFMSWALILERGWYMMRIAPRRHADWLAEWMQRSDNDSWRATLIRDAMVARARTALTRRLGLIRTMVAVLPTLGLLGTVSGMIHVFDVMATLGTGNARAMASGISRATLPTMAGLVVAIAVLYFSLRLQSVARERAEGFENQVKQSAGGQ